MLVGDMMEYIWVVLCMIIVYLGWRLHNTELYIKWLENVKETEILNKCKELKLKQENK